MNNNENNTNFLDVLGGNASFKIDISLSYTTIIYIALAVFVVGIALIGISKAWPGRK